MDSLTVSDFEHICRLCLGRNDKLIPILGSIFPVRIMDCVSLEVSATDEKPKFLCGQCIRQISAWYSFKQMCKNSDTVLEKTIKDNPMVVPEPVVECIVKPENSTTWEDANETDGYDSLPEAEPFVGEDKAAEKYFDVNTPLVVPSADVEPSTSQLGFHCKSCNISFEDNSLLSNHSRIVHPKTNQFNCFFCGDVSESSIALIQHERTHRTAPKRNVTVSSKPSVRGRRGKRKRTKPKRYSTSESDEAESKSDKLTNKGDDVDEDNKSDPDYEVAEPNPDLDTVESVHNRKGKQVCLVCGKKFLCMAVLVTHERRVHLGEPIFQCQDCGKTYTTKRTLTTHMGTHQPEKHHSCDICDKTFTHKTLMNQHKVLVHSLNKPFKCSLCPKSFIRRYMLKTHQVVHTKEKAFTCEHCHKDFSRRESLKVHMRFHSTEPVPKYVPPRRYICTLCGKDYISPGELNRHELVTHKGERPYKCDLCDKAYASKFSLQVHQAIHSMDRNHICELCGKRFNHSTRLAQHKSLVHHTVKPFKCFICEKSFLKPSLLKKHQVVHTGERCETCDKCDKTFGTREGLKQHLKTHSELKRFSCQTCGKRFAVNKSLKAHACDGIPYVSVDKSVPCPGCGKMFMSKKTLGRHMTIQRCDQVFSTPEELAEHMRSIPDVKRFPCNSCGKRFSDNAKLDGHRCGKSAPAATAPLKVLPSCPTCGKKFANERRLATHVTMQNCSVSDLVFAAMSM